MRQEYKKNRISLEYKAFPIWTYNDSGNLIDNDSPEILRENLELDNELVRLQEKYNNLFINDGIEFSYKGFANKQLKDIFETELNSIIAEIQKIVGNDYEVENNIDISKL